MPVLPSPVADAFASPPFGWDEASSPSAQGGSEGGERGGQVLEGLAPANQAMRAILSDENLCG